MKYKIYITLFLIVLGSFVLRFYKVAEDPPALNWDETSIAYNAYSILKTGKDEWGQFFPVHFKAYGEYKLPVQVYASIPGIAIFGLNELGVRITPVVYGTITILVTFFLARALFQSEFLALMAAFLLAISPWHIQLTRASFESSFAVLWVELGIWFLIKGFSNKRWLIYSMIPFAISTFTYNSALIFTPLFLFAIALIYHKTFIKMKRTILVAAIIFMILLLPETPYLLSGNRSSRYKLVSITDDAGLIPRINQNRGNSKLPQPLPRLIHNRITYVAFYFTENYLSHFTPQFLFISGAPHKQHSVQNMGELYFFQAPFLLFGLYLLFKRKNRFRWLLISWILLVNVPVATTNDSIPNALRTAIAASFYQILTALGIWEVVIWLKNKHRSLKISVFLLSMLILLFSLTYYFYQYYVVYPVNYSRDWQYGYQQAVDFVNKQADKYDLIVFTRHYGEPHMFTLFYLNYPPALYQNNPNLDRFETNNWVWVLKFDMFYFASNGEQKKVLLYFPDLGDKGTQYADIVKQNPGKKLLFIGKPGDFPADKQKLFTVNFLNGDEAFEVVESK